MNDPDSIPTRQSLLARLKDCGDQESLREFFDAYWRLIHATAHKAGLTDTEAQEVVQEVMIAAAKKMPGFTYEPGKDSLKGWLLSVTAQGTVSTLMTEGRALFVCRPGRPLLPPVGRRASRLRPRPSVWRSRASRGTGHP